MTAPTPANLVATASSTIFDRALVTRHVGTPSRPSWDIAERKSLWQDGRWVSAPGRNAEIYVLALHDVADETADHRDATQWRFYTVAAIDLPSTKRIGRRAVEQLADSVPFERLRAAVNAVAERLEKAA